MPATSRDHARPLPECRGDCRHGAPGSRTSPGAGRFSPVPGAPDRTALIRSDGHGLAGTGPTPAGAGARLSGAGTGLTEAEPGLAGTGPRLARAGTGLAGTGARLAGTGTGLARTRAALAGPASLPDVAEHDVIAANCDSPSPDEGLGLPEAHCRAGGRDARAGPAESLAKGRREAQVWITRMEIARNRHIRVKLRRGSPMASGLRAVPVTRGERRVHHVEAEDEGR